MKRKGEATQPNRMMLIALEFLLLLVLFLALIAAARAVASDKKECAQQIVDGVEQEVCTVVKESFITQAKKSYHACREHDDVVTTAECARRVFEIVS